MAQKNFYRLSKKNKLELELRRQEGEYKHLWNLQKEGYIK